MSKRIFVTSNQPNLKQDGVEIDVSLIEQKISSLESLRDYFQSCINNVLDKGLSKEQLKDFVASLTAQVKDLDHKMLVLNDSLAFRISTNSGEQKTLKQRLDMQEELILKANSNINVSKQDISILREYSEELLKKCDFKDFVKNNEARFVELSNFLFQFKSDLDRVEDEFKAINKKLDVLQEQLDHYNYASTCEHNKSSSIIFNNQKEIENIKKDFDLMFPKLTAFVRSEISAIQPPKVDQENQIPPEEIKHKLHLSNLDASNATLKANNAIMQVQILEKKVENLTLKLNEFKLNK